MLYFTKYQSLAKTCLIACALTFFLLQIWKQYAQYTELLKNNPHYEACVIAYVNSL